MRNNCRVNYRRPLTAVFLAILIILCTLMICPAVCSPSSAASYADYTTERFNVEATADQDHVIHMKEQITVNFSGSPHHGITRYIPQESGVWAVRGVECSEEYETEYISDSDSDYCMIRIGDPDRTVTGQQKYVITYDIVGYRDDSDTADYLALDLLPTGWETPIERSRLTLTMPKKIDWSKATVYSGVYGSTETDDKIQCSASGRTLTVTGENLPKGYGVTVKSDLPEGYWVNPANRDWVRWIFYLALLLVPLVTFLLWLFFGRDPKIVPTVEFYAPEGMTPAEVGYIIDGSVDNEDVYSQLMYMAQKGYLRIHEYKKDHFEVIRVSRPDDTEKGFVCYMFDSLFSAGDTARLDDMPEEFGQDLLTVKDKIKSYYSSGGHRLFSRGANICRVIGIILMTLPMLIGITLASYENFQGYLAIAAVILAVIQALFMIGLLSTFDRRQSRTKAGTTVRTAVFLTLTVVITAIGCLIITAETDSIWAGAAALASVSVTFFFVLIMKAMTARGAQLLGKVLGFREFIRTAEYDRLKALSDEDPEYFFNVMPYAYVMGMQARWARKFTDIRIRQPQWYSGTSEGDLWTGMMYYHMMDNCFHGMRNSVADALSSDDGGDFGGFDSGGGFSGGGFSGGGFGGGGGGAW